VCIEFFASFCLKETRIAKNKNLNGFIFSLNFNLWIMSLKINLVIRCNIYHNMNEIVYTVKPPSSIEIKEEILVFSLMSCRVNQDINTKLKWLGNVRIWYKCKTVREIRIITLNDPINANVASVMMNDAKYIYRLNIYISIIYR